MKKFFISIYKCFYKCSLLLFYFFPIRKNKIVILRDWGLGYGCNMKYLAEYIISKKLPFEIVWILNAYDKEMPTQIKQVKLSRIKSVYELSTAKFVFSSVKFKIPVKKSKNQYYIYIPHGQAGAKPCLDEIPLKDDFRKLAMEHSAIQDLFVASSAFQAKDFADYYWCKCEILRSGYPRNDIYFQENNTLKSKIRKNLNISNDYNVALWAPTFRDNGETAPYSLDINRIIQALEKNNKGKWLFIVRLHPNLRFWYKKPIINFSNIIKDVTDYPDIQELFLISDIVITDYSSTMFDFALTRKPVFLYATDIDDYIQMRGLKDLYFKTPFPLCRDDEELELAINSFDMAIYQKNLDEFYAIYNPYDEGHASEMIVEKMNMVNGNI